jgi:hypothetical protein
MEMGAIFCILMFSSGVFMTKLLRNILNGAGSVVDLWSDSGNSFRQVHPYQSDVDALKRDWQRVGNDIADAIEKETRVPKRQ